MAALAAAALGPLALYVATLPRTVVLEDDGLFLMAGVHLGVAHPPGYPLYTLILHLFTRLPFGDPAVLGHLSSALLGALACGAVYGCARLLRASLLPALTAAWLFGVSEQFWSQAIITEVYTLNGLLFFATYALVMLGARDRGARVAPVVRRRRVGGGARQPLAADGAGHAGARPRPAAGLARRAAPAAATAGGRPRERGSALRVDGVAVAPGTGPSASTAPSTGGATCGSTSVGRGYSGVDVSPAAGWSDRAGYLGWFAADLVRQTTLPGAGLAVLGLRALARRGGLAGVAVVGSGALALVGNSIVLIGLLGLRLRPVLAGRVPALPVDLLRRGRFVDGGGPAVGDGRPAGQGGGQVAQRRGRAAPAGRRPAGRAGAPARPRERRVLTRPPAPPGGRPRWRGWPGR